MIRAARITAMNEAAEAVVRDSLAVQATERVLVVADTRTRAIGDALREAAARAGAEAVLALMDPRERHAQEPPDAIAAALLACDVFIAPTTASLSHTTARKAATENGARGATLPGVTEEMLARVMTADLGEVKRRSDAVAELLTDSAEAHVSCPRGTDFTLDLTGRAGHSDDGDLRSAGAFGNLPCGEGYVAPLNGRGRLIVTSLAGIGLGHGDLIVEDGRLVRASGDEGERLLATLRKAGELGTNLAELGVGTNEKATLTGVVLEDEKMLGTVHIAFGASMAIGGTVSVPVHLDSVIVEPTLRIGATTVIEGGRFLL
jgi:leucyl aminopeptidase (aminopeptidase T)